MRPLPHRLQSQARAVTALTGLLWVVAGVVVAVPALWALDALGTAAAYLVPGLGLSAVGAVMFQTQRQFLESALSYADATVGVMAGWLGAIITATSCLLFTTDLTVAQAVFEATSGFTTTGLSVVDVESADRSVLILRSLMELAGGAGLAIIMVTLLSGAVSGSVPLAEGRNDHLVPDLRHSASLIVRLYFAYSAIGVLALWAAGMSLFDAFNHALAAVSTGGFSTKSDSIGHWDSLAVELVIIVLMVLGSTSFLVVHRVGRRGWRALWDSMDVRVSVVLVPAAVALVGATLVQTLGLARGLRVSLFEVVSAWSTTGFSTVSYVHWAPQPYLIMVILMIIGGGAGSTAGGLKQARVFVLWRLLVWQWRSLTSPEHSVERPKYRKAGRWEELSGAEIRSAVNYTFIYLATFALGCVVFTGYGFSVRDAMFEVASTMGTVGLSIGITSPDLPSSLLMMQSILMLLGRLEFFVVGLAAYRVGRVLHFTTSSE